MEQPFPHLFSPLRIGTIEVRNRVLSSSHGERMSENNRISTREIAYYEEKARGGTGVIVLDGVRTSRETAPNQNTLIGTVSGQRDGYRRLADAVHAHGAKMLGQVLHQGAQTATTYSRRPLVSASAIANPVFREIPHALDKRGIRRVIEDMVRTAVVMREGGLDGVELHAAHGYLIGQFLSAKTNHRTDEYGGDLDRRMRFGSEAIAAIRGALGRDFVFGIRLNAADLTADGCTAEDMLLVASQFVAVGALDFLSISAGTYYDDGLSIMVGDFGYKPGFLSNNARAFKAAFPGLPIITVGRITTPELAESIIASGEADMVAMTRAIIADPAWAKKASAGEAHRIRPCIACNTCLQMNRAVTPITCAVNPSCGEEARYGVGRRPPALEQKTVLVVGGGVAGLEAARSAAERGHRVVLFEQAAELGGQVGLLTRTKSRAEMRRLIDYYRTELQHLDVDIRVNHRFTEKDAAPHDGCRIIIATGARGRRPTDDAFKGVPTTEALALLTGNVPLTGVRRALVVDRDHYYGATTTCHHLRDCGIQVDIVTENAMIGADLPPGALAGVLGRLVKDAVKIHPLSRVEATSNGTVRIKNLFSGAVQTLTELDLIVVAGERVADDDLYETLMEAGHDVVLVGDAMAPRQIWQAVRDGYFAGQESWPDDALSKTAES